MVVAEINSGLGNQMFQYAAGLSLSQRLKVPLLIDRSWYDHVDQHQTPRQFELDKYPIELRFAESSLLDHEFRLKGNSLAQRIRNKLNRMMPYYRQRVFVEPHFHYDPHFEALSAPVMLSGYWQSERYFMSAAEQVRSAFITEIPARLNPYLAQMEETTAVSVHVRRGDMVNNPDVMQVHGYCNLDYYKSAIRQMNQAFPDCRFFVFSDDLDWCRENLADSADCVYVEGNEGPLAYLDIQLMRNCHHHIIANSSFSWWGAWLNPRQDKRVIAPRRWFAHDRHDTRDLIPASWQRI